jgi:hypothetical protein
MDGLDEVLKQWVGKYWIMLLENSYIYRPLPNKMLKPINSEQTIITSPTLNENKIQC